MPGQVHLISWQSEAVEIFDTGKKFERVTLVLDRSIMYN